MVCLSFEQTVLKKQQQKVLGGGGRRGGDGVFAKTMLGFLFCSVFVLA
jgi:hypothetical protein